VQAMRQAGLVPAPALEVDFNADELAPSVLAHLTTGAQRPTALFCSNDLLAMVVIRGLRRARVDVPRDMSILGFDGLAMGELLAPPLASIGSPNRGIGCAAWHRLIARIDGQRRQPDGSAAAAALSGPTDPSLSQILPHTLRIGATVAAIAHAPPAVAKRGDALAS